jgi:hypothetical protein
MEELLKFCEVQDVTCMYDKQCTKQNVLKVIAEVGARCEPDDYFVFYYAGHGTNVEDLDGDEEDGQDEAFCFVDRNGRISQKSLLTDDEFAEAIIAAVDEDVRVLILTDCCHSGTIADLDKDDWGNIHAISITGCLDEETSGDIGRGGIFTHSMLLAIDKLENAGEEDYSVGFLYNATVEQDDKVFRSAQNITIQSTNAVHPDEMAWPLIPLGGSYEAPFTKAMEEGNGNLSADLCKKFGIPASVAGFANINKLTEHIDPAMLEAGANCLVKAASKNGCAIM